MHSSVASAAPPRKRFVVTAAPALPSDLRPTEPATRRSEPHGGQEPRYAARSAHTNAGDVSRGSDGRPGSAESSRLFRPPLSADESASSVRVRPAVRGASQIWQQSSFLRSNTTPAPPSAAASATASRDIDADGAGRTTGAGEGRPRFARPVPDHGRMEETVASARRVVSADMDEAAQLRQANQHLLQQLTKAHAQVDALRAENSHLRQSLARAHTKAAESRGKHAARTAVVQAQAADLNETTSSGVEDGPLPPPGLVEALRCWVASETRHAAEALSQSAALPDKSA